MNDLDGTTAVAAYLGIPAATLRWWRHVDKGPASFKLGRRVLYRRVDVDAWIAAPRPLPAAGSEAMSSLSGRGYGLGHHTQAVGAAEYRQLTEDLLDDLSDLADRNKNSDTPRFGWQVVADVEAFIAHWRDQVGDM